MTPDQQHSFLTTLLEFQNLDKMLTLVLIDVKEESSIGLEHRCMHGVNNQHQQWYQRIYAWVSK